MYCFFLNSNLFHFNLYKKMELARVIHAISDFYITYKF